MKDDKPEPLADRRKALEEEFFREQNARLLEKLRAKRGELSPRERLECEAGVTDDGVLETLLELGLSASCFAAVKLIPLVAVAWADGRVHPAERSVIRSLAEAEGAAPGTPAFARLEEWLARRPDPRLLAAWEDYLRALQDQLGDEATVAMRRQVLDRARRVAAAAGGFLGFGPRVSRSERRVLRRLERTLGRL